MNKRILLTGGAGFIGSIVLKVLLYEGYFVRCIIRCGSKQSDFSKHRMVEVVETDDLFLESPEWWAVQCKDIDAVIHMAWYTNTADYLISERNLTCHAGTVNLASGAIKSGVKRFVAIGTSYEYEMSSERLSTSSPLNPKNIYSISKSLTFLALSSFFNLYEINFLWCRLFDIIGEHDDSARLVPYIKKQIQNGLEVELTDGGSIRDFMHVEDVAKDIVSATMKSNLNGAINICSGIPISVKQLALEIARENGAEDLLRFGAKKSNHSEPKSVVGVKSII